MPFSDNIKFIFSKTRKSIIKRNQTKNIEKTANKPEVRLGEKCII